MDSKFEEPVSVRAQKNFQENPQGMYTWDYAIVFKVGDKNSKMTVKHREDKDKKDKDKKGKKKYYEVTQFEYFQDCTANVIHRLRMAGLKTDLFWSVQKDEVYCRIAASEVLVFSILLLSSSSSSSCGLPLARLPPWSNRINIHVNMCH